MRVAIQHSDSGFPVFVVIELKKLKTPAVEKDTVNWQPELERPRSILKFTRYGMRQEGHAYQQHTNMSDLTIHRCCQLSNSVQPSTRGDRVVFDFN